MFNRKVEKRKIDIDEDLLSALKQMDRIDKKLLLVFDAEKFVNVLSVGDIQKSHFRKCSFRFFGKTSVNGMNT